MKQMTHRKITLLMLAILAIASVGCDDKNEDITDSVNKNGAIETAVQVTHLDSMHDLLTTTHKIWVKHSAYKTVQYVDTIPALGQENTVAENEEGDTRQVTVPKDYEIYITVK